MSNWNDPAARLALIESVGIAEYNRRLDRHFADSIVETVAGHDIRIVESPRWGRILVVGATGKGFASIKDASAYAQQNPVQP